MTNPTTPFSWQMPTASDLVTDLPADFETFGQAVATSMADLLGGTTGQVLSKASNTDMDFTWVAQDDSNAIQNAIVDAKGDLIAATAADTPARLAVGTNGQLLTADSTAATGLKWASPAAAAFVGCSLTKSAAQSIPNATETVITFDTESFDTDAFHSTSTNTSRITIPAGKAGKYLVVAQIMSNSATAQTQGGMRKNGSGVFTYYAPKDPTAPCVLINMIIDLAVADYLEIFVYQGSGSAKDVLANSYTPNATIFSVQYLGA